MSSSTWTPVDETASAWKPVEDGKYHLSESTRQLMRDTAANMPKPGGVKESLKRTGTGLLQLPGHVYDAFTKPPEGDEEKLGMAAMKKALPMLVPGTTGGEADNSVALGLHRLFVAPLMAERQKAINLQNKGKLEAIEGQDPSASQHMGNVHAVGSLVPVVGPMSADIVDRAMHGDKAGAAADLATAVIGPKIAEGALGGAAKLGTKVIGKVAPDVGERLYQSALKPSTTIPLAKKAEIIRTGLDAGIPISPAGAEKLSGLISDLNDAVAGKIKAGAKAGQMVDPEAVASRLDQTATKFANQVNPDADLAAIAASKKEFLTKYGAVDDSGKYAYRSRDIGEQGVPSQSRSQAGLSPQQIKGYMPSRANVTGKPQELIKVDLSKLDPADYKIMADPQGGPSWVKFNKDLSESAVEPTQIPVEKAQALKQGTYQQLKSRAYGELKSATEESQKALARGLKEELEVQFPEIKGLNAQESKFYNLNGVLEKALNRIGNHQLMGLGTPIAAGAGAAVAGGPGAIAAAVTKAVLDNPAVKSRLAIALNKAGRGKISLGMANARVNQFVNALAQSQASNHARQLVNSIQSGEAGAAGWSDIPQQ